MGSWGLMKGFRLGSDSWTSCLMGAGARAGKGARAGRGAGAAAGRGARSSPAILGSKGADSCPVAWIWSPENF